MSWNLTGDVSKISKTLRVIQIKQDGQKKEIWRGKEFDWKWSLTPTKKEGKKKSKEFY